MHCAPLHCLAVTWNDCDQGSCEAMIPKDHLLTVIQFDF